MSTEKQGTQKKVPAKKVVGSKVITESENISRITDVEKELSVTQDLLSDSTSSLEAAMKALNQYKDENKQLEYTISGLKKEKEEWDTLQQSATKDLRGQLTTAQEELHKFKGENMSLHQAKSTLESGAAETYKELAEYRNRVSLLNTEIQGQKDHNYTLAAKIVTLQDRTFIERLFNFDFKA